MSMEYANIALGVLAIINGWILVVIKANQSTIESLKSADASLGEKLAAIQLLIAGSYLTRDEFRNAMREQTASIVKAIEHIDSKVDRKLDK